LLTMLSAVINIGDIDFVAIGNNDNAKVSNNQQLTKGKFKWTFNILFMYIHIYYHSCTVI